MTDEVSELTVDVDGTTIRAVGEVDYTSSGQLHAAVDEVLSSAPGALVDFDLAGVEFMDSSGLGSLVGLLKLLPAGGVVRLAEVSTSVQRVLRLTRLDTVLQAFPTVELAVG
jgi:anti-anti-sigma factor